MTVRHKEDVFDFPMFVVQWDGASLLGRNWFTSLGIRMARIQQRSTGPAALQPLPDKFHSVLDVGLTGWTVLFIHLELLEGTTPKFLKGRLVPFTLRPTVQVKHDRLEK